MLKIISSFILTSLAFAGTTLANETSVTTNADNQKNFTAQLSADANQKQLRRLLASQGYIVTSVLVRDEAGRWNGTALKDGKTVNLAVKLPFKASANSLTN